ncbi:MAG: DUF2147 domain-containing protein [Hyphomicrobium sp.]|jgi:uncharacterized protein (DUF2147 family)
MRFERIALYCSGLAVAMLVAGAAHADNSPLGLWIDHTGRGGVEITDCGGKLCGRVAWLKDAENAKECGKKIIGNVAPVGKNKWDNGWIYDPDRDSKYDVELTALDNDKLRVMGYAGSKWLSETHTWKRAPADLQKCSTGDAVQATPSAAKSGEATAKADPTKPAADDKSAVVQLDAAKPHVDTGKTSGEKSSVAKSDSTAPAAKADENSTAANADADDEADDEPTGGKKKGKVIARLMAELENGDGPVKLKRSGKTCKVTAPFVGVISFPCDKD